MMLSRSNRSLMVAIAFITMCAAMLFDAQGASAQLCCGFGIYNNTDCPYRVRLVTATVDTTFAVPTGGGSWTIPNCDPFHLIVRDACGVDRYDVFRIEERIGYRLEKVVSHVIPIADRGLA